MEEIFIPITKNINIEDILSKNPKQYSACNLGILRDSNFSATQRLMYCELIALSNEQGVCYINYRTLGDIYDITSTAVAKNLKVLKEANLIDIFELRLSDKDIFKMLNIKNSKTGCLFCGFNRYNCIDKHHYPIRRKDGGTNTINLCPNCHRLFHVLAGDIDKMFVINILDKEAIRYCSKINGD